MASNNKTSNIKIITMEYKDKLKDPRWIKFSKKVYAKDGYSCGFNCGWTTSRGIPLVAHHTIYYVNNGEFIDPWDYSLDDMQTLCKTCHDTYHIGFGISSPIIDRKTNKIINEDEPTRRTRLAIEQMKKREIENEKM